jgi:hypothetical protein
LLERWLEGPSWPGAPGVTYKGYIEWTMIQRDLVEAAGRLVEKDTKTHAARRLALSADRGALLEELGVAVLSGRRPGVCGCPRMPMGSPSTQLAASPCIRTW